MKNSILLIILILSFISCQQSERKSYVNGYFLNGSIEKSLNGKKVFLKTQENKKVKVLDSTTIIDGKFNFKGRVDKPEVYGIFIDSIEGTIGLFIENGNITIEANKDNLSASIISGSKINDDYLDFIKRSNQIISEMNILFPEFQKARAENDAIKLEEINKKMQIINDKNTAFILGYARQNPKSYISAVAIQSVLRIPSLNKDTITNIFSKFSDYVKKGEYSKEIEIYLNTPITLDSIQN